MGQVWVRLPVGVERSDPNGSQGLGKQTADIGGPEGRMRGRWGLAPGSDSSARSRGCFRLGMVGSGPPTGLFLACRTVTGTRVTIWWWMFPTR